MAEIKIQLSDKKYVNPHFVSEGELRRAVIDAYKYKYDETAYDNKSILNSGTTLDGHKYPWYMRLHADLIGFMYEYYRSHFGYYYDLIDMEPYSFVNMMVQPYVKDNKWRIASDDFLRAFMTSHYWQAGYSPKSAKAIRGGKPRSLGEMLKSGGTADITKMLTGMPMGALNKISRMTMMPQTKLSIPELHAALHGQQKINSRSEKILKMFPMLNDGQKDDAMKKLYERIVFYRDPFDYAFKKFGRDTPSVLLACHVMDKVMSGKPIAAMETIAKDLFSNLDKVIENLSPADKTTVYRNLLQDPSAVMKIAGYVDEVLSSTRVEARGEYPDKIKSMMSEFVGKPATGGKKRHIKKRSHTKK